MIHSFFSLNNWTPSSSINSLKLILTAFVIDYKVASGTIRISVGTETILFIYFYSSVDQRKVESISLSAVILFI